MEVWNPPVARPIACAAPHAGVMQSSPSSSGQAEVKAHPTPLS